MKTKTLVSTLAMAVAAISMLTAEVANAQIRSSRGNHSDSRSRYNDGNSDSQYGRITSGDRRGGVHFRRDKELVLRIGGDVYGNRGGRENGTFYIKKQIKAQYPNINLQNYDLESVQVVGVSEARRSSNSTLTLEVSGRYQDQAVLEHRGHGRRGMDTASMVARERAQDRGGVETWQIKFSAATKVQRVIVNLEEDRQGGGGHSQGPRMQSVGTFSAQALTRPLVISVGQWANSIQLKGVNKPVAIISVEAIFANGDKKMLDMKGFLAPGLSLSSTLGGERRIRHLVVSSMAPAGGKFEVLVGTRRR